MQRNTFIATVENDTIYAVNGVTQEKSEVGITQKSAKDLQDALAGIIQERDEYYQRLVDAKLIEPKRSAEEMARERAMCEAYDIACKPCQLTPCDVDMLYKLMDIAKDTYEASKYAMEVADLATHAAARRCEMNPYVGMPMMEEHHEHHDHESTAAKS